MAYSGKFKPKHPEKYVGDVNNIVYRSIWERNVMKTFDTSNSILAWGSEELVIPYQSPVDGNIHRYFPDFFAKVRQSDGSTTKFLIEVKPLAQTKPPVLPKSKRKTKRYREAMVIWLINDAKWKAARKWCEKYGYEFKIMTEHECT
jgi:hypothetical protein